MLRQGHMKGLFIFYILVKITIFYDYQTWSKHCLLFFFSFSFFFFFLFLGGGIHEVRKGKWLFYCTLGVQVVGQANSDHKSTRNVTRLSAMNSLWCEKHMDQSWQTYYHQHIIMVSLLCTKKVLYQSLMLKIVHSTLRICC